MASSSLGLLGVLGALICIVVGCSATTYMVGDTAGWDISTNLGSWATGKTFKVGDVLAFQYSSTTDSVCEATKQEFDTCKTTNALQRSTSGNTTFPLTKPGDRYFVCCNQLYCLGGMKLHVQVESNSTDDAAAASPVRPPQASPGPKDTATSFPRTSKSNNNPVVSSSSDEFIKVNNLFLFCFLGFLSYFFWVVELFESFLC